MTDIKAEWSQLRDNTMLGRSDHSLFYRQMRRVPAYVSRSFDI
jgi:hypothetical protein